MDLKVIQFRSYSKKYNWLSNFYPFVKNKEFEGSDKDSYKGFLIRGHLYKSVEHFYQSEKFEKIGDRQYADIIRNCNTAIEAKKMGGKGKYLEYNDKKVNFEYYIKNGKRIRTKISLKRDIDDKFTKLFGLETKKQIMLEGLRAKFIQDEYLKKLLIDTGDTKLEEIGRFKGELWTNKGLNLLGDLLAIVRQELNNV
jgi:predicted NAD-dependent protein-ADP-ribosyltransferase YbiA (DUF1768 family)